ncbi:MAG: hypothetical protein FWD61_14455 [Phycisphaerales bacterium]|nr:hypothetical protein [Phycisphaerales bacterium]
MAQPLNPTLYTLLLRHFGKVNISSEGQQMAGEYRKNISTGRDDWQIQNPGEYYCVNCPYCSDTRQRLYINHRWGVRDAKGRLNLWLAVCYNENCMNPSRRQGLWKRLQGPASLTTAKILPGKKVTDSPLTQLPGPCTPLDQLDPSHSACAYLAGRLYDPVMLGKFYGVSYCLDSRYTLARERIVAPIYLNRELRGWQARYIGELTKEQAKTTPKWWSDPHMKKSMLLYNYDNARKFRTVVIVEGPGDVWSFGPMAVATFGTSFSERQAELLRRAFTPSTHKERLALSCVLLWDPDVRADEKKIKYVHAKVLPALKQTFGDRLATVWLPDHDPGFYTDRGFLRRFVECEAQKQGVKVDWNLR